MNHGVIGHAFYKSMVVGLSLLLVSGLKGSVRLTSPDLEDSNIIGYNAGLRPYRKSGIRLEKELVDNKLIVHNYGHGGAGITLSWGCAEKVRQLMEQGIEKNPELKRETIAIIGAGVNGLSVAHKLLDKGYNVRIYTKELPPKVTSNVAIGIWGPFSVARGPLSERQNFMWLTEYSYQAFVKLATDKNPAFKGISFINVYEFNTHEPDTSAAVEPLMKVREQEVIFVDQKSEREVIKQGKEYQSLVMDGDIYITDLLEKVKERGAEIIIANLVPTDIANIEEEIVINCSGLGARELFNDHEMMPIRGQMVYFEPQHEQGVTYGIYEHRDDHFFFYLIPWQSKLILAGNKEKGVEEAVATKEVTDEIVRHARAFFDGDNAEETEQLTEQLHVHSEL